MDSSEDRLVKRATLTIVPRMNITIEIMSARLLPLPLRDLWMMIVLEAAKRHRKSPGEITVLYKIIHAVLLTIQDTLHEQGNDRHFVDSYRHLKATDRVV